MAQLDAMAHNALACALLEEEQVALAPRLNAEWKPITDELRKLPPPSPEQMAKAAAETREASLATLRERFKLTDGEVAILSAQAKDAPPPTSLQPPPAVLLDDTWVESMSAMAAQHRKGAELWGRMKQALEGASR
jgi:hypothetical protein